MALLATSLHAAGYSTVRALLAVLVFEKLGAALLRKAWFNPDLLWVSLLAAAWHPFLRKS